MSYEVARCTPVHRSSRSVLNTIECMSRKMNAAVVEQRRMPLILREWHGVSTLVGCGNTKMRRGSGHAKSRTVCDQLAPTTRAR